MQYTQYSVHMFSARKRSQHYTDQAFPESMSCELIRAAHKAAVMRGPRVASHHTGIHVRTCMYVDITCVSALPLLARDCMSANQQSMPAACNSCEYFQENYLNHVVSMFCLILIISSS